MTSIELINLTLNEIRRTAQAVADVKTEQEFILKNKPLAKTTEDVMKRAVERDNNALEYCRKALRDVLEHIANYQNNVNMVRGVDGALGKVAYDLIYERKTDEDYESKTEAK